MYVEGTPDEMFRNIPDLVASKQDACRHNGGNAVRAMEISIASSVPPSELLPHAPVLRATRDPQALKLMRFMFGESPSDAADDKNGNGTALIDVYERFVASAFSAVSMLPDLPGEHVVERGVLEAAMTMLTVLSGAARAAPPARGRREPRHADHTPLVVNSAEGWNLHGAQKPSAVASLLKKSKASYWEQGTGFGTGSMSSAWDRTE